MKATLQAENEHLRSQLQALLAEARQNEEKMRRFDELEGRLIATRSLAPLVQVLLRDYPAVFDLDAVSLVLVDPGHEIAHMVERATGADLPAGGLILLGDPGPLEALFPGDTKPFLGAFDPGPHGAFLGPAPAGGMSVALLPLVRQGALIGSLNLGSRDGGRFTTDSGTHFLQRLAAIAAACLESALNYERLKLAGLTDALTGIYNRRYFECRCLEEITRATRHRLPLACMFLDIDKFKRINDSRGHLAGDEVLRTVAQRVQQQLRGSDIIARYGGEEFVVLLPHTPLRQACEIAERIRATIAAQAFEGLPGTRLQVTISIGLSTLPADGQERDAGQLAERLIGAADQALYRAKDGGRNRVVGDAMPPPAARSIAGFYRQIRQWGSRAAGLHRSAQLGNKTLPRG